MSPTTVTPTRVIQSINFRIRKRPNYRHPYVYRRRNLDEYRFGEITPEGQYACFMNSRKDIPHFSLHELMELHGLLKRWFNETGSDSQALSGVDLAKDQQARDDAEMSS